MFLVSSCWIHMQDVQALNNLSFWCFNKVFWKFWGVFFVQVMSLLPLLLQDQVSELISFKASRPTQNRRSAVHSDFTFFWGGGRDPWRARFMPKLENHADPDSGDLQFLCSKSAIAHKWHKNVQPIFLWEGIGPCIGLCLGWLQACVLPLSLSPTMSKLRENPNNFHSSTTPILHAQQCWCLSGHVKLDQDHTGKPTIATACVAWNFAKAKVKNFTGKCCVRKMVVTHGRATISCPLNKTIWSDKRHNCAARFFSFFFFVYFEILGRLVRFGPQPVCLWPTFNMTECFGSKRRTLPMGFMADSVGVVFGGGVLGQRPCRSGNENALYGIQALQTSRPRSWNTVCTWVLKSHFTQNTQQAKLHFYLLVKNSSIAGFLPTMQTSKKISSISKRKPPRFCVFVSGMKWLACRLLQNGELALGFFTVDFLM